MSSIKPSISGPKRPQDLILLSDAKQNFKMQWYVKHRGFGLDNEELAKTAKVDFEDHSETIQTGHVAIADNHIMYQYL